MTASDAVAASLPCRFFCADGSFSSSATLFYSSLPGAVKHLFHSGYIFPQVPLWLHALVVSRARARVCKRVVRACVSALCARVCKRVVRARVCKRVVRVRV